MSTRKTLQPFGSLCYPIYVDILLCMIEWFGKKAKPEKRETREDIYLRLYGTPWPDGKPATQSPDPAGQEAIKPVDTFREALAKNEVPLRTRNAPEGMESPRTVNGHIFKYGKHVIEAGGRIQPRIDYHMTARPDDKSLDALGPEMHPNRMPFGTDDLTNWERMPFQPIIKVTRMLNGVPYIICGKAEGRSETGVLPDGTRRPGRSYVESTFVAIPASVWSVAFIPQLRAILDTTPRVGGENKDGKIPEPDRLPSLELTTDNLDAPLPEDWFDKLTKDLIVRVAGGSTISIQDWKMPQQDSLDHIFRLSICLPEEVARRMAFGSGIGMDVEKKGFGLRVYHGMINKSGQPGLRTGNPWDRDDVEKNKLGEEYLAALKPLTASAKTPREVMLAVLQLPPDLVQKVTRRIYPEG